MLTRPPGQPSDYIDLGAIDITPQHLRRYAEAIDDRSLAAGPCDVAPLGFALAMRGGPVPEVQLENETVTFHAGHAITMHRRLTAPGMYGVRARIKRCVREERTQRSTHSNRAYPARSCVS